MKKFMFLFLPLLFAIVTTLGAVEQNVTEEQESWNLTCTPETYYPVIAKGYDTVDENNQVLQIALHDRMSYDKKTGIVTLWVMMATTPEGAARFGQTKGEYIGYILYRKQYNLKTKKMRYLEEYDYSCTGQVLETFTRATEWDHIKPGSLAESMYDYLKKRYKA